MTIINDRREISESRFKNAGIRILYRYRQLIWKELLFHQLYTKINQYINKTRDVSRLRHDYCSFNKKISWHRLDRVRCKYLIFTFQNQKPVSINTVHVRMKTFQMLSIFFIFLKFWYLMFDFSTQTISLWSLLFVHSETFFNPGFLLKIKIIVFWSLRIFNYK